jgi:hypothetical protein
VATDLGAWPAEQATVLLEVLQRDGLTPEAKRTRDGIHVLVPDAQSDQAYQVLAANMDVIANAARLAEPTPIRSKKNRKKSRGAPPRGDRPARSAPADSPALTSERLMRVGPAVALLLTALLLGSLFPQAAFPIVIVGAFAGIWWLGKQAMDGRDG